MREYLGIQIGSTSKRLFYMFHHGKRLSDLWWIVEIDTSTFWLKWTNFLYKTLHRLGTYLILDWGYKRIYSKDEFWQAQCFQIIPRTYRLCGENYGTAYDDGFACPICGSGARQLSPLKLSKSKMPRTDLAMTIAEGDEIFVSERFVEMVREHELTGIGFAPVYSAGRNGHPLNYYQIRPLNYLDFSGKTIFGVNPFDQSGATPAWTEMRLEKEGRKFKEYKEYHPEKIYKCPNGDNLGLNILSEAYIKSSPMLEGLDFFASRQTVGMREGVIRPRHLFFCSNRMMNLIKEHKLKGFQFEVAHIVDE